VEWNKYTTEALDIVSKFLIETYKEDEDTAPVTAAILIKRLDEKNCLHRQVIYPIDPPPEKDLVECDRLKGLILKKLIEMEKMVCLLDEL